MYPGMLPYLVPHGLKLCQLVSRSDLILELTIHQTFWAGSFLSRFTSVHLVLQSFRQSGALLFLPCSHKHAVAHMTLHSIALGASEIESEVLVTRVA